MSVNHSVDYTALVTDERTQYEDTGVMTRVFELDHLYIDRITIQFHPDDEIPSQLLVYENGNSVPAQKMGFDTRNLSFSPISVLGRGESETLLGISPSVDSYNSVPDVVKYIWNTIGFTVVPEGRGWQY